MTTDRLTARDVACAIAVVTVRPPVTFAAGLLSSIAIVVVRVVLGRRADAVIG